MPSRMSSINLTKSPFLNSDFVMLLPLKILNWHSGRELQQHKETIEYIPRFYLRRLDDTQSLRLSRTSSQFATSECVEPSLPFLFFDFASNSSWLAFTHPVPKVTSLLSATYDSVPSVMFAMTLLSTLPVHMLLIHQP